MVLNRKAASVIMMIAEIIVVLFVIYTSIQIAQVYASSETVEKITIADDLKMMIDTLVGLPGDAVVEYPANVSKYTFILSSGSVTVFIKGEGEQKYVTREFSLPPGYSAFGTVEGKEKLCLEKEKRKFLLRECETPAVKEKVAGEVVPAVPEGPSFYGIPVTGNNIVFVIDRSISMEALSGWKFPTLETAIEKRGDTKLDAAVWQLKIALEQLSEGNHFNILFFNHEYDTAFPQPVELHEENRAKAYQFADGVEAIGGTNIYDPLKKAVTMEGVETVFLLTDGRSYLGISDSDKLIAAIDKDNVNNVKINTIGVFTITGKETSEEKMDKEIGIKLLKGLAEKNNGIFAFQGDQ